MVSHSSNPARPPTVPGLIALQAHRVPDAVAVEDGRAALSYAELMRRSAGLAQVLLARGAGRERRIAVRLERSADLLVALLAVLRSGSAFVPVEPGHPPERQRAVLADSRSVLLLQTDQLSTDIAGALPVVGVRERPGGQVVPLPQIHPEQAAYMLYTSGSTGTPKGVLVPHGALARYLAWAAAAYRCAGPAVVYTSPGFDLTLTALFGPLLAGGSVWITDDDMPALVRLLAARRWALLKATPSHLDVLNGLREADCGGSAQVGTLVIGGEALRRSHVEPWLAGDSSTAVFNEYGPTEAVVGCCVHRVGRGDRDAVPIGKPVPYATIALVNGELLVGGPGLARGYPRLPGATARRFVPDPAGRGARRYRTGDRSAADAQGLLWYTGRIDRQLKIRGHRVEPGEVEAVLRSLPSVRDAAVLGEAVGDRRMLVGYVVAEGGRPDLEAVRAGLAQRLPDYLVPGRLVALPALPLSGNGKVDHAKLAPAGRIAAALARLDGLTEVEAEALLASEAPASAAPVYGAPDAAPGPEG